MRSMILIIAMIFFFPLFTFAEQPAAMPASAKLSLNEEWSEGKIDPKKWYILRKQWGNGNHGVVPENVYLETDLIDGRRRSVLVCRAHGDLYDGPVFGQWAKKDRVGGVIVSKEFFASGRYEVVMKIGTSEPSPGSPSNPREPAGAIPAIWTYGYRWVTPQEHAKGQFNRETPLFNPHLGVYDGIANEYWSEIDFPEFGKNGDFSKGLYNTFLQKRHDSQILNVGPIADGEYHTFTTDWRTHLVPISDVRDDQVIESNGFWWVQDKSIPIHKYEGNPLKRLGSNQYEVYAGLSAKHWIDGKLIGVNSQYVPSMAAQLNLGVWLPDWGGEANWKVATVRFARIRIWQYNDPGDVRGVLTSDIDSNFDATGQPLKRKN